MSDNDLIKRVDAERARDELVRVLNYINTSGTLDYADYCELFDTIEREFDALKVVPHEMSAREFVRARDRICDAMATCADCSYKIYCIGAKVDAEEEVAVVEAWAKEHNDE